MAPKPFITAGVALTSAALIVAGTPTLLAHEAGSVTASAPTPTKISNAKFELAAITSDGLINAYVNGYGGFVGAPVADGGTGDPDPYFNGFSGQYVSAAPGVLYYVVDDTLKSLGLNFDLDNYYFEIGNYTATIDPTFYSGLAAVAYVGAAEYLGPEAAALVDLIQEAPYYAAQAFVGLTSAIVPVVQLGPLTIGGGILADAYFNGYAGYSGLPAIGAYIINSFLPPAPEQQNATVLAKAAPEVKTAAPSTDTVTTETVSSDAPSTDTATADVTTVKPGLKELADSVKPTLKPGKPGGLFKEVADALSGKTATDSTDAAAAPAGDSSASTGDKSDAPKGAPHKSKAAKTKKSSE